MDITAKIFGWLLLLAGVAIIGWTLMSSYGIFTGKAVLPELFQLPEIKTAKTPVKTGGVMDLQDIQGQLQQMMGEQLKSFLPTDTLPKILNLFAWSILAGILIFGGSQISGLGIKLIKK